jgi:hypothetical protein
MYISTEIALHALFVSATASWQFHFETLEFVMLLRQSSCLMRTYHDEKARSSGKVI